MCKISIMTFDIVELVLVPPFTAGLAAWLTYLFTARQSTGHERYSLRRSAADDLYLPLRQLQAVIRKHRRRRGSRAVRSLTSKPSRPRARQPTPCRPTCTCGLTPAAATVA